MEEDILYINGVSDLEEQKNIEKDIALECEAIQNEEEIILID